MGLDSASTFDNVEKALMLPPWLTFSLFQVLHLHVGQAGTQLGNSAWELYVPISFTAIYAGTSLIYTFYRYLLEHGLKADGHLDPESKVSDSAGSFETFFSETGRGKYVPRSIFVDLDPSVWTISSKPQGQMLSQILAN